MNHTSSFGRRFHILTVTGFLLLWCGPVSAQIAEPGYNDKLLFRGMTGVTIGGMQQQWTLSSFGTVVQQSAPITLSVPVSNRILFTAANSAAVTRFDSTTVSGMADTRLTLSYVLPGDKLWLTAGASLPTGKTSLTTGELQLTSIISQTALGYRIPIFGQGYGVNAGLAYGSSFTRRIVFGVGLSYSFRGPYDPISSAGASTAFRYDPGDEAAANIGIDYITYSKAARFSADITASYFLNDDLNGKKIFQAGPRVMGFLVYSLTAGAVNHMVSVRVRYRMPNTFYSDTASTEYDAAVQTETRYAIAFPLTDWAACTVSGELKLYSSDQVPLGATIVKTGEARIGSVGAEVPLALSSVVTPVVSLRYAMGSIVILDPSNVSTTYDVTGIEAGLGLRISW